MKRNSTFAGRFALTGVAVATLCLTMPGAWALGLGRLQVQSALGESLRAEIDVTSMTPEEASNLRVRIASPEAYRTAGVDYNSVLPSSEVSLQRRADGRPYLRISSNRGVQEPFVDVILELNWATGRLVREYTLLFDPPLTARSAPPPSTVAPQSLPTTPPLVAAAPVPPAEAVPPAPPIERRPRVRPPAVEAAASTPPSAPALSPRETRTAVPGTGTYKVRPGDSLSRIASHTQRQGVSLDQMLVSLFRGNPDAFIDNNMNRLRSGVVLEVPSADTAKAISTADAHQVIQAQSADFGAYRQRLAGAVPAAKSEGSSRQSSGKLQATVTDSQQGAVPAPDKLTLSKGAAEEQRISREREKKAADVRVAELSKNVDELKKLSSAASRPASAPAVTTAPVAAPLVVAAAPPPAPPPPPPPPAPVAAPASAAAVVASAAIPAAVVATTSPAASGAVAAASAALAAASRPSAASEPAAGEPGLLATLIEDNPVALGLGALLILALGGFAAYRFSKRAKRDSGETSFLESRLQPDSFFGASGGQRIDTRDAGGASSSMSYSLSQLDAIGDVDPVAEADVYLAYGRDLQAEEILKEAMRSNPDRMAIRTKLLEVYAKRRDTKGFELLATQLFALTQGVGEDWARAQELGQQIDPDNPLYHPGGMPTAATDGGQLIEPLGASTMPQSVLPTTSQFGIADSEISAERGDLGLDLDLGDPDTGTPTSPAPLEVTQAFTDPRRQADDDAMSLDFSMPDLGVPDAPSAPAFSDPPAAKGIDQPEHFDLSDISFDLDPAPPTTDQHAPAPPPPPSSAFGDLELPALDAGADSDSEASDDSDPLARKLELADEFRQIGDSDGARDLLQEVIAKSSGAVKRRAQSMLADLG